MLSLDEIKVTTEDFRGNQLPQLWVDTLIDQQLFKCFVPRSLGGLQLDLHEGCELLLKTARIHGGLGWVQNLVAGANYFCGFFDEITAQEIYTPKNCISSGSGFSSGTSVKNGNAFSINGTWKKCSASAHASHFTFNALNENGNSNSYIIPADQVQITPDWYSFGLKTTSSNSIVITAQEIPLDYTFNIGEQRSFFDYKIYQVPFECFARTCLSATFQGMIEGLLKQIDDNRIALSLNTINEMISELQSIRLQLITAVQANTKLENNQLLRFYKQLGKYHLELFSKLMGLFVSGPMVYTEENTAIHWQFRDIMTAIHHYLLKPPR